MQCWIVTRWWTLLTLRNAIQIPLTIDGQKKTTILCCCEKFEYWLNQWAVGLKSTGGSRLILRRWKYEWNQVPWNAILIPIDILRRNNDNKCWKEHAGHEAYLCPVNELIHPRNKTNWTSKLMRCSKSTRSPWPTPALLVKKKDNTHLRHREWHFRYWMKRDITHHLI